MTKDKVTRLLHELREFKKRTGATIIDTHVHPTDVMGVHHYTDPHDKKGGDILKPGALELFDYNVLEKIISRISFALFPSLVDASIHQTYEAVSIESITQEFREVGIDKVSLLSLEPWTPTKLVFDRFGSNNSFFILCSIDMHTTEAEDIEGLIKSYKDKGAVGIKLHSNLQDFMPQPKDNPPHIGKRLHEIYKAAEKYNLHLLFHGGRANFTKAINAKYPRHSRNKFKGLLENFCAEDGSSELFDTYKMPIVIAHIGHYGMIRHNYALLKTIVNRHDHVFFDTSGISPSFIRKSLNILPSSRILFGSDAMYNRMAYNLAYLFEGVMNSSSSEDRDTMLVNILGKNYLERVLR